MAKRFRFRLETLLKVRRLREREAKRKLAAKQAEIARLDRLRQQAEQQIRESHAALRAGQQPGVLDLELLWRRRAWVAHLRRMVVEQELRRAKLVGELAELQAELGAARTRTRILEKLRQRRWDQYVQQRRREEQAAADELAQQLLRSGRASLAGDAGQARPG